MNSPELLKKEVVLENGEKVYTSYYMDSIRHGIYEVFTADDLPERSGYYYNDSMSGRWVFYDSLGRKKEVSHYRYNKLNGRDTVYFPDGGVQSYGSYIMDIEEGPWYFYFPNGQLKHKVIYVEGRPLEGSYMTFDSTGKLLTDTAGFENIIHK